MPTLTTCGVVSRTKTTRWVSSNWCSNWCARNLRQRYGLGSHDRTLSIHPPTRAVVVFFKFFTDTLDLVKFYCVQDDSLLTAMASTLLCHAAAGYAVSPQSVAKASTPPSETTDVLVIKKEERVRNGGPTVPTSVSISTMEVLESLIEEGFLRADVEEEEGPSPQDSEVNKPKAVDVNVDSDSPLQNEVREGSGRNIFVFAFVCSCVCFSPFLLPQPLGVFQLPPPRLSDSLAGSPAEEFNVAAPLPPVTPDNSRFSHLLVQLEHFAGTHH